MRASLYGYALAASLLFCPPVSADEPVIAVSNAVAQFRSSDARLHANKQIVYHIINDLILSANWENAAKYVARDYIEHNPNAPSGFEGQRAYFLKEAANRPPSFPSSLEGTVVSVTAEGDRVIVTSVRNRRHPDDPAKTYTIAWFDMWRIENGKAVEHWDADSRDPAGQ